MTGRHVSINRDYWNEDAENWVASGEKLWALNEPEWGIWSAPDRSLNLLPKDMTGMSAIELGCGTGYVSAWMAKRGAKVTGVDISSKQLATARRLNNAHKTNVTFLEANAEATGLPDAGFDFAISEYGAAIWCDPDIWLPEAARLLKPGGTLVFLGNHPLTIITAPLSGAPAEFTLHRPYRDLTGADWTEVEIDPAGIEFNRTTDAWFKLFNKTGFAVIDYHEIYAPSDANETSFSVPADWAKSFSSEQIWHLKRI